MATQVTTPGYGKAGKTIAGKDPGSHSSALQRVEGEAEAVKGRAVRFYKKFSNDWTMNLTGMLAYNVLTSFFPLMLALITLLAFVPFVVGNTHQVAHSLSQILPGNVRSQVNIDSWLTSVNTHLGLLTLVSVAGLLWGGSNLFGAIENAFAIIFRVNTRGFVAQKMMSVVMVLIFAVLVPLSFASTFLMSATTSTLGKIVPGFLSGPYALVVGYSATFASLFVLFVAIYTIVPNVPIHWRYAWRGAIVAAVLMTVINVVFPFYAAHFMSSKQYGAAVLATAITAITWFWFFSLVLLIGAQVNSLVMGIGYWKYDITRSLMDAKIATEGGVPTAVEALEAAKGSKADDTPLGLARDSVKTAEKDEASGDARPSSVVRNAPKPQPANRTAAPRDAGSLHRGSHADAPEPAQPELTKSETGGHGLLAHMPFAHRNAYSTDEGDDRETARPAHEMSGDLIATGIATGGVQMATQDDSTGPPDMLHGMVVAGVVVGLLQGLRTGKRRAA